VRLVLLSDTHCMHDRIDVPDGDIVVHAGDFSGHGGVDEAQRFARWFGALPHPEKVVIAGNHDRALEADASLGPRIFEGCHYLFDAGATIAGLTFWGSPWQPWFLSWAFNLPRGPKLAEKWSLIPEGVDVLVTHGPPARVLDRCESGDHAGCEDLLAAIERARPRLHVFGHIHEGYGEVTRGETRFVNASNCTLDYAPTNEPIVVDLEPRR
jgi:predicted phosphohydrolase